MTSVKTSELVGAALDWAVAKCEGGYDLRLVPTYDTNTAWQYTVDDEERMDKLYLSDTSYSTDWGLTGPIIEREKIAAAYEPSTVYDDSCRWKALAAMSDNENSYGPTPLIAAMRCYVASKLGSLIEIPSEFL